MTMDEPISRRRCKVRDTNFISLEDSKNESTDDEIVFYAHNQSFGPTNMNLSYMSPNDPCNHGKTNFYIDQFSSSSSNVLSSVTCPAKSPELSALRSEDLDIGCLLESAYESNKHQSSFEFTPMKVKSRLGTLEYLKIREPTHVSTYIGESISDSISDTQSDHAVDLKSRKKGMLIAAESQKDAFEKNESIVDQFTEKMNIFASKESISQHISPLDFKDPISSFPSNTQCESCLSSPTFSKAITENLYESWAEGILQGDYKAPSPSSAPQRKVGTIESVSIKAPFRKYDNQRTLCQKLSFLLTHPDTLITMSVYDFFDDENECVVLEISENSHVVGNCSKEMLERKSLQYSIFWNMQNLCFGISDSHFKLRVITMIQRDSNCTGIAILAGSHKHQKKLPCIVDCFLAHACTSQKKSLEEAFIAEVQGPMIILPCREVQEPLELQKKPSSTIRSQNLGFMVVSDEIYSIFHSLDFGKRVIRVFAREFCPLILVGDRPSEIRKGSFDDVTQWGYL